MKLADSFFIISIKLVYQQPDQHTTQTTYNTAIRDTVGAYIGEITSFNPCMWDMCGDANLYYEVYERN